MATGGSNTTFNIFEQPVMRPVIEARLAAEQDGVMKKVYQAMLDDMDKTVADQIKAYIPQYVAKVVS